MRIQFVVLCVACIAILHCANGQHIIAEIDWQTSLGGNGSDSATVVRETANGGYVIGGWSDSQTSSGTKESVTFGNLDYWVVELDTNGIKDRELVFGGTGSDELSALELTADNGYLLGGTSRSGTSGNKETASFGSADFWIVKVDTNGTKQWERAFGGSGFDSLFALQQTSDGGFILGGESNSSQNSGNKQTPAFGGTDYWVIKLNSLGNVEWQQSYGGSANDQLTSLQQTSDGGYILGGWSGSGISGNKTSAHYGQEDYWVIKTDASGVKQWERSFGNDASNVLYDLQQTPDPDNGYILGGSSSAAINASGNQEAAVSGSFDYWLIKLSTAGNKEWEQVYGGNGLDSLRSLDQTSDGGYILGGESSSTPSGNRTAPLYGSSTYWIVKTDSEGSKEWEQSFGGGGSDSLNFIVQNSEEDYVLAGTSSSSSQNSGNKQSPEYGFEDFWVLKLKNVIPFSKISTLSWTEVPDSTLESISDLNNSWISYQNSIIDFGALNVIDINTAERERYFRLRKSTGSLAEDFGFDWVAGANVSWPVNSNVRFEISMTQAGVWNLFQGSQTVLGDSHVAFIPKSQLNYYFRFKDLE